MAMEQLEENQKKFDTSLMEKENEIRQLKEEVSIPLHHQTDVLLNCRHYFQDYSLCV